MDKYSLIYFTIHLSSSLVLVSNGDNGDNGDNGEILLRGRHEN